MNKEITTLEGEMVLRNAQISELQQKIVDADQGLLQSNLRSAQSFATQRSNETPTQSHEPLANQNAAYSSA